MIQARYDLNDIHRFFPLEQLKQKFHLRKLKDYFSLEDLIRVGFKPFALYRNHFSEDAIRKAGYTEKLMPDGYTFDHLNSWLLTPQEKSNLIYSLITHFGYTAKDFKDANYPVPNIKGFFSLNDLLKAGYTDDEISIFKK
jgi:hypothetical protein